MGQVWEGTSPRWAGAPPHKGPRRLGLGGNPKGGRPLALGGKATPLAAAPSSDWISGGRRPSPLPLYICGGWEVSRTQVLAQPSPSSVSSSSPAVLGEALQDCHAPPSPPRHCAAAGWSLPQPLPLSLLDQGVGDVTGLYVC